MQREVNVEVFQEACIAGTTHGCTISLRSKMVNIFLDKQKQEIQKRLMPKIGISGPGSAFLRKNILSDTLRHSI